MMVTAAALAVPTATAFVTNPSAGSAFTRQTFGAMRGGSYLWWCVKDVEMTRVRCTGYLAAAADGALVYVVFAALL